MIGVTERAKEVLKEILDNKVDYPGAGLRLTDSTESGHLALKIDVEEPGDQVVKHEGLKVLLVEERLSTSLDGIVLDVEDTPDGKQLVVSDEQ